MVQKNHTINQGLLKIEGGMGRNKKYWIPEKYHRKIVNCVNHAIHRCQSPKVHNYHRYGGRGIKVWKEWIKFPEWFAAYICTLPGWDTPKLSLDRIDNDKGYFPGNLRWATQSQQTKNSCIAIITGKGTETDCIKCNKHFIRRRERQKFCSRKCASEIGWKIRWGKI